MKKIILCSIFVVITISLFAQTAPDTLWTKTLGGNDFDGGTSVQQTMDGGYIIGGYTYSYGQDCSFWLIKTDINGNIQWTRIFGDVGVDCAYSAKQTLDGGYIIAGYTETYSFWSSDILIIKTNENGYEEWSQTFWGSNRDKAYSVEQTLDGGYIIAGITTPTGDSDFWLIKTDEYGNEEWNKTFGGDSDDYARSVKQTSDGGYIIAGYTNSYSINSDFWIVKTDQNGDEEWNNVFEGVDNDLAYSVQQTSDYGYIIAGWSSGSGPADCRLLKTDEYGNEVWNHTYGGYSYDYGSSVQQTLDGGFIIAGDSSTNSNGECDFWLIKTDSLGNLVWDKTIGGYSFDIAYSVQQTTDSGYIVVGSTSSYGNGECDLWLIRLAPEISITNNIIAEPLILNLSNYPNPFNPTTTISFNLTAEYAEDAGLRGTTPEQAKLIIYNLKGQKIKTFSNLQITQSPNQQITWDGTDENNQPVSSGIYFYKLNINGKTKAVKKCLLLK